MLQNFRYISLIVCCCIAISSLAQMPGTKIFTLGSEYQEPPHINTIYQLENGYILLGTTKGLYKFDGVTFSSFDQGPDVPDTVTSICETPDKEIFIGYSNGLIGHLQNNYIVANS